MKLAQNIVDDMKFERVHRIGANTDRNRCRNIVAKFSLFKERELVRKQWKPLQGSDYYVREQFPKEVNDKRRQLLPRMKDAKRAVSVRGCHTTHCTSRHTVHRDTLYIDGKPVKDDTSS